MGTVTVESLDLRFKARSGADIIALNNLNLTVPDKQFAVIVGPSGCGKSSLLDIIAGLKEPSGGVCRLDGKPISELIKEERHSRLGGLVKTGLHHSQQRFLHEWADAHAAGALQPEGWLALAGARR